MKKIINKHFKLEDKIYHSDVDIIVGDWEYFGKYLKSRGIEQDVCNHNWLAETGTIQDDNGVVESYYIRLPEIDFTNLSYCTAVHELAHLTFQVLYATGVKFGVDNQEPYTYLLEMFLNDFLKKARKLY